MDNIKDIERKGASDRLLNRTVRTQPFGSNVVGNQVYRRTERIAAAVHLVTNHISAAEPARARVRKDSIDLLSAVLSIRDEMRTAESNSLKDVQARIRKLISTLQVLFVAGHLSLQNVDALVDALDDLGVFLAAAQRTPLAESHVLTRSMLLGADEQKDTLVRATNVKAKRQSRNLVTDKNASGEGGMSNRVDKAHVRSEKILGVLRTQDGGGIKDIVARLPEYSEKMIQRELKDLVAKGRVKKTGSKRWSTYSLS